MFAASTTKCKSATAPERMRRWPSAVLALVFLALSGSTTNAAHADVSLLLIEQAFCEWCEAWDRDVGGIYAKTEEGREAPLRRLDISAPVPEDVTLATRARFTPTFVLLREGREIGRIEGYPGEHFFWPLLNRLLEKLPPHPAAGEPAHTADDEQEQQEQGETSS